MCESDGRSNKEQARIHKVLKAEEPLPKAQRKKSTIPISAGSDSEDYDIDSLDDLDLDGSDLDMGSEGDSDIEGTDDDFDSEGDDSEDEGMGRNESEDGEYVDRSYQYYELENRGDVLFTRTYATNALAKENGLRLLNLSLKDLEFAGPLKGLYVVRVQDAERQWMRQEKLVTLTDLGLIARQGVGGGAVVFVNSLRNAKPVGGATVRFISTSNQVMGTAVTNGQGVARFDSVAGSPLKLGMVTATHDADFSFLALTKSQVETSRFNVGGLSSNAAHYQAFLYGDRDLYRPGDTIHTNVVVRTDAWQTPPLGLPLKVRLLLPTGKEYASL
ncbi:MAG: hypothetical protein EOO40_11255, partial [Deltaproteobacteria bacterium]